MTNTNSLEDHKQNIGFGIEFSNVDWGISPHETKRMLEEALRGSNIQGVFKYKISLMHVRLEP